MKKQKSLKIVLGIFGATVIINASEVEFGKGTFKISGGFIGLNHTIKNDVTTYSMVEQHASIFKSSWFYKYNITWYDSEKLVAAQNTINTKLSNIPTSVAHQYFPGQSSDSIVSMTTPSIDYRPQGLDINLGIGKDLYHKNENDYLGIALMVGLSTPYIDSKKDSNNNDSLSNDAMNAMKKSKTKIYTYKIGLNTTGEAPLGNYFSLYGSATYAFQTGTMKNSYANSDLDVDGTFQEYDIGIKFQPLKYDKKIGWFTFSPRLYATLGYRYSQWTLDDVAIDITGIGANFDKTDFKMKSSIGYFGIGYSF